MTDLTTIVIKDVEENEDGSATYSFDLDSNSSKKITELGLEFVLTCAAYNMDIQEALDLIRQESMLKEIQKLGQGWDQK